MFREVKLSLKLMLNYMKFNLSSAMEYRTSFIIQTMAMAINNSAFIFFWWILFENLNSIGGYAFVDVMRIWALSSTSFGIANILFGNSRNLTSLILKGDLDTYLLQPKDVLINLIASKSNISAWGDAIYGLLLISLVEKFSLTSIGLFLLLSLTGGLFLTSFMITLHSLSFYMGNMESFAALMTEFLITFSTYPEGIFTEKIKWIFYSLAPVAFIAYLPRKILLDVNLALIAVLLFVLFLWIVLAYSIFYKGLKRYESGNLISTKL